jgi:protoporphyrinogen oxidase
VKTLDALVIGAGPAGLTTAYTLAKAGRSVLVVEQDPTYVGGISRTVNYKGFLFDIGGHRFFSKSKEVVDLWNEILPDDFIERPRLSRIYYRGKFFSYPLKAFGAFRKLGPAQSALCLASFAYARVFPIKNAKTVHQWVRNQFGERLFRVFFKTYTEKVWGMSCDEISAEWGGAPHQGPRSPRRHHGRTAPLARPQKERRGRENLDRILPLSAPRTGNNVGGVCR